MEEPPRVREGPPSGPSWAFPAHVRRLALSVCCGRSLSFTARIHLPTPGRGFTTLLLPPDGCLPVTQPGREHAHRPARLSTLRTFVRAALLVSLSALAACGGGRRQTLS